MLNRRTLLLAGIGVGSASGIVAQSDDSPAYKVGDRWTFVTNPPAVGGTGRYPEKIVAVDGSGIVVATSRRGTRVQLSFSRWMNPLDLHGKEIMQVRHPLSVGASWSYEFTTEAPDGRWHLDNTRKARVTAKEIINVPAGAFECFRIDVIGFWTDLKSTNPFGPNGGFEETSWYAPQAKRVVRHESRTTLRGSGRTETVAERKTELTGFEIA